MPRGILLGQNLLQRSIGFWQLKRRAHFSDLLVDVGLNFYGPAFALEFSFWLLKEVSQELVISLALTRATAKLAGELVRKWIVKDLSGEEIEKLPASL